jgi:putative addiction module component (TIGR02574 family)
MKYPTEQELLELSGEERLKLLDDIWDTFVTHPESLPVPDGHLEEVEARLASWQQNPSGTLAWEDVKQRIIRK